MIYFNNEKVIFDKFPDGTILMKNSILKNMEYGDNYIKWRYDSEIELLYINYIVSYLRNLYKNIKLNLIMPFVANSRMDRVKDNSELFTLKYFCNIINSMNFDRVSILDPHSNVCVALLNNVYVQPIVSIVYDVVTKINMENGKKLLDFDWFNENFIIMFPDEGSHKKYSDELKMLGLPDYVYGVKEREWKTGNILSYKIIGEEKVKDKNVFIIDDICSKGTTFYFAAKKLKEIGSKDVYLYVSHCENTIEQGELLKDNSLIKKIYTTDSIYRGHNEKVEVIKTHD